MKNVLDKTYGYEDEIKTVKVKLSTKNIHVKNLAERYARSIYLYYGVSQFNIEDGAYMCFSKDPKVKYPSTDIVVEGEYVVAKLITSRKFEDSFFEI